MKDFSTRARRRLPFLKDAMARPCPIRQTVGWKNFGMRGVMSPDQVQSFLALAIGFAVAGLISTGFQLVASRPASFGLLSSGPSVAAFAAIPMLVFAAPFLITRTIVRAGMAGPQRFEIVMGATI